MPERTAIVASTVGLHARPAAVFVKAAGEQPAKVRIRKGDGEPVDVVAELLRYSEGSFLFEPGTLAPAPQEPGDLISLVESARARLDEWSAIEVAAASKVTVAVCATGFASTTTTPGCRPSTRPTTPFSLA